MSLARCKNCTLVRYTNYHQPDPCLGWLPGVKNACCGHGSFHAYVQFENGDVHRGEEAKRIMRTLGGYPPETNIKWETEYSFTRGVQTPDAGKLCSVYVGLEDDE